MADVEIWDFIPGYEGKYQASNHGRIRSVDRITTHVNNRGTVCTRYLKGRILSQNADHLGYKRVGLGVKNTKSVHRLVALVFVPGRSKKLNHINHLDSNPGNNRYSNLEWIDASGNAIHAIKAGRKAEQYKKVGLANRIHKAKLTAGQVIEIRRLAAGGEQYKQIAKRFGVTGTQIGWIAHRKSWAWLK